MGLVGSVVVFVATFTEWVCLLLDLNFVVVHTMVRALLAVVRFVNALPSLCISSCLSLANSLTYGLLTMFGSLILAVEGLVEIMKMVGYLSMHMVLRGKDHLNRSLESVVEGFDITVSLVVYFTNTVINFLLIATQKLFLAIIWLLQMIWSPLNKVLEVTLTVLTFLYSSLLATAAILWPPCKPLLDFSLSFVQMFSSVFILNFYGLMLTLTIALTTTAYLYPQPARQGCSRLLDYLNSFPATRRLHAATRGFLRSCIQDGQEVMRVAGRRCRRFMRRFSIPERFWRDLTQNSSQIRLRLLTQLQRVNNPPRVRGDGEPREERRVPPDGRAEEAPHRELLASCSTEKPPEKKSSSGKGKPLPENLLTLFTEQEERKKCVICQDCVKTVVLLPCRHLCLCRDCTSILQRQPIYQQNCPLCRRMILNTVDVYL
ncbi:E3 ubiquitin-protein ligase RNF26 [Neosynchiropus ocellatus]